MELLRQLNDSFSACGYEEEVRAVVAEYLSRWYTVSFDHFGNVIATKTGTGAHLAFAAPMDTGGFFLNSKNVAGQYHYNKLSADAKTNAQNAAGRTFDGHAGVFVQNDENEELSYFDLDDETVSLPMVADITVPFSVSENQVVARQGALFALLNLAKKLSESSCSITVMALAQTTLRQRGAYGNLPRDIDFCVLIETIEEGRFHLGDGAVLCLKDGIYMMPESIKKYFSAFENRLVCEIKPSLAAVFARQQEGRLVASVKIPVRGIGTSAETFCPADVEDLCDKLVELVGKRVDKI